MPLPPGISECLIDSWPVLEYLKDREPATTLFEEIVVAAMAGDVVVSMSRMNYGEVLYSIAKGFASVKREQALRDFRSITLQVYSVDDVLLDEAVALKSVYSISYADSFAAALAVQRNMPVVTGDPEFRPLESDGLLQLYWVGK